MGKDNETEKKVSTEVHVCGIDNPSYHLKVFAGKKYNLKTETRETIPCLNIFLYFVLVEGRCESRPQRSLSGFLAMLGVSSSGSLLCGAAVLRERCFHFLFCPGRCET